MQWKLIGLFILFVSVILHEIAHGYSALHFGDDTAKRAGRLTLDPLVHVDLLGTIIVPMLCMISGSPVFGWAKPVPVDFNSLPNRMAELWVSLSGILVNFSLAILAGIGIRLMNLGGIYGSWPILEAFLMIVIYMNLMLGIFNLLPVPPLDGWRIWGVWLPYEIRMSVEANPMVSMILLFMLLPTLMRFLVSPAIAVLFQILAGVQM